MGYAIIDPPYPPAMARQLPTKLSNFPLNLPSKVESWKVWWEAEATAGRASKKGGGNRVVAAPFAKLVGFGTSDRCR